MTETPLRLVLAESLDEVLEKMFFIRSLGEPQNLADEPAVTAHLTFEGSPPGWLTLRVTADAARSVAADFLGEEGPELSDRQIGEVVCELANMICGSVLSRVESTTAFRLATPQLVTSPKEGESAGPAVSGLASLAIPSTAATHAAEIGNGAMAVTFNMETPAWSTVEKSEF